MACAPIFFISSTSRDLKDYREAAAKAARGLGFFPLRIGEMELPEIKAFFRHFSQALLSPANAAKEFQETSEEAL